MLLHFLSIPTLLHINEYKRKCYLKLQKVERRLSLKLINSSMYHDDSGEEGTILRSISTCLATAFAQDYLFKDVCIAHSLEK